MALSLKNPETQAKFSSVLVAASLLILSVALVFAFSSFDWTTRVFVYSTRGMRMPMVFGMALLSLGLAGGAFWFSYSSAGERRNSYSRMSWISFAVSAFAIVLSLVFIAAYQFMAWKITQS